MTHRVAVIVGVLLLAGWVSAGAQMDPVDAEVVLWSAEIGRHEPGTADDPAKALAQWQWRRLRPVLQRLFTRRSFDATLVSRAAAAYGDIALFTPREQRPIYPELYKGDSRVTLSSDGQPVGQTFRDTHLRVAQELIRRVVRRPEATGGDKAFAARWYGAVAAVLANAHDLAGLKDHLEEARDQFPEDAEIQFLSGCLAESIASPAVQAMVDEIGDTRLDLHRQRVLGRSANLGLASHHYKKALEIDPRHDEARIRLARVWTIDGEVAATLPLLEREPQSGDPILRYYRFLFLGRAYDRTKRRSDARAAYEAASRLFPDAQSPGLALSALAAAEGDIEASRRALARVVERSRPRDDPWWIYDTCNGRNAGHIYSAFTRMVTRLGTSAVDGKLPR